MTHFKKLEVIQFGQEWQDKGLKNMRGVRSLRGMGHLRNFSNLWVFFFFSITGNHKSFRQRRPKVRFSP